MKPNLSAAEQAVVESVRMAYLSASDDVRVEIEHMVAFEQGLIAKHPFVFGIGLLISGMIIGALVF